MHWRVETSSFCCSRGSRLESPVVRGDRVHRAPGFSPLSPLASVSHSLHSLSLVVGARRLPSVWLLARSARSSPPSLPKLTDMAAPGAPLPTFLFTSECVSEGHPGTFLSRWKSLRGFGGGVPIVRLLFTPAISRR